MGSRINKIFGMSRVTSKGSAPELVKRETDTRVTCTVDALKHSETLCAITMRYMLRMERTNLGNSPTANIKEKGISSRIDDEVVQDKRQRDDNDLQDKRQDQPKEEEKMNILLVEKQQLPRNGSMGYDALNALVNSLTFSAASKGAFVMAVIGLYRSTDFARESHVNQYGFVLNGLVLSQAHYVDKILNTHNAGDSGQARTPIDTSLHLSKNRGLGVAQLEYSRIIGMLMYLMTGTRPDLAYAVSRLSRYTSNPSYAHWKAITRVLHYLRYSRDYGLHYDRHPAVIEGYSDANWISDIKDSRSTSGYVFTLGGAAISWKSSKQTVIAKSTMESEFIALDKCGEEAEWLRQFVEDIPRWPKPVTAISIHCDSKSAMGRAKSTMYNGKSRHIRRRHNSIRQLLSTGVISIDYVASKDNIADPFTKGLSRELVSKSSKGMGLKPLKE
ncbi:hypothetical protein Tco_0779054 [Tanacetum coccineum]